LQTPGALRVGTEYGPRVAKPAPLTVDELEVSIGALRTVIDQHVRPTVATQRGYLRELHQLLLRAAASGADLPPASLGASVEILATCEAGVADGMQPRVRTAFRLLRAGAFEAAWAVVGENAVGVVDEPFRGSTATGEQRATSRLPLLTRIESLRVFADLPGFRDPRFEAPDGCYDITATIRVRYRLDEVQITEDAVKFGGSAALNVFPARADDVVRLIATGRGGAFAVVGSRCRQPDLRPGTADLNLRREWAGWSARLELADSRLTPGTWTLALEIGQAGIARRAPMGANPQPLASAAIRAVTRAGGRSLAWETHDNQLRLVVGE